MVSDSNLPPPLKGIDIMKSIKQIFVAAMIFILAVPAMADNQVIDSLIGGAIGGAAGNQIGKGRGKQAATVVGALAGAWLGGTIGDDSGSHHRDNLQMQQRQINSQNNGYGGNVQRVVYEQVPQRQTVQYVEAPQRRQVQQVVQQNDCDSEYYNGEYDPEVASAFCQGQQERARQNYNRSKKDKERAIRAAYQAGLEGQ
jgi:uncharacterized protein YcfJ